MNPLDDKKIIQQFDPQDALQVAANEPNQLKDDTKLFNLPNDAQEPNNIIVTGMGGSALAASMAKTWLNITTPFEVIRDYTLPKYASNNTLVIVSSYSGNTEEALAALSDAEQRNAKIAIIAAGGKLLDIAVEKGYCYAQLTADLQPRMAVMYNLKALVSMLSKLAHAATEHIDEITQAAPWLEAEIRNWLASVPQEQNLAKQLAVKCLGKTPVIYAGSLMAPVAYKWKISFNENAKNTAFTNALPEFNHNEFIGWSSHPIEKPFAVIDLISNFEHPRVLKRFEITDRLLSGMRPKAISLNLEGDSILKQLAWGSALADFVSIYLAILNGVNPTPVDLVEKLKHEMQK